MESSITYKTQSITIDQLKAETESMLQELRAGGELRDAALEQGIEVDTLFDRTDNELIQIRPDKASFDAHSIVIILAPVAGQLLKSLWQYVLLPKIRQRYGADALEENKK